MSVVPSPEIQLGAKRAARDVYRHNLVFPQTGAQTLNLTSTSAPETIFEIPSKPLNLAKSYLQFSLSMPAVASRFNAMACRGVPQIQRMSLYTRSGLYLADVPHFGEFSQTVIPATTKQSAMEANGSQKLGNGADPVGCVREIGKTRTQGNPDDAANDLTVFLPDKNGGTTGSASAYLPRHAANGLEIVSERIGAVSHMLISGAPAIEMRTNHMIPLDACRHTILSLDKSMYFPEVLLLRVQWAPCGRYAKTYAESGGGNINSTDVAEAAAIGVTNLGLHLALSSDPVVMQDMINKVLSGGMSLTVPFVHGAENNYSQQQQSINLRANSGFGRRLLCAYHTVFSHGANAHRHICNNNSAGNLVVSYYTALDSQRLQDQNMRAAFSEPYMENRKLLQGSALQGASEYAENFVHIDSWRAGRSCDWIESDYVHDGLTLENAERTYTIFQDVGVAPSSDRYSYTFMVVQKELSMDSQGISLV